MAIHGFVRATVDIDILIQPDSINADGKVLSLNLLLVTPQVEDVWQTREEIDFLGNRLSVVSREGLIKMKRLAGKPQALADVERLANEES